MGHPDRFCDLPTTIVQSERNIQWKITHLHSCIAIATPSSSQHHCRCLSSLLHVGDGHGGPHRGERPLPPAAVVLVVVGVALR